MKKYLPLAIIGILFVIGGVLLLSNSSNEDKKSSDGGSAKQSKAYAPPQACTIFALDDAKKVLGDSAEKPEGTDTPGASSDDIEVSQCIYETPAATLADIKTQRQASILVRGAKTDVGAQSNRDVFLGSLKPAEAQDVSGYGEAAYWNPQFGQFNIFKSDNWYILSVGVSTPSEKKLEEAKVMADAIIGNL